MANRNEERQAGVIIYVASLNLSAYRFAKGLAPLNFEDTSTSEFLISRYFPFIMNEDLDYRIAHQYFLQNMFENGWVCGQENFSARTHPDLVSWDQLPKESKELYGYSAALVCSAKDFYQTLKTIWKRSS